MIDPAILRAMLAAGATAEAIVAAVEAAWQVEQVKRAERRAGASKRQRECRERKSAKEAGVADGHECHTMSHDVTVTMRDTCDTDAPSSLLFLLPECPSDSQGSKEVAVVGRDTAAPRKTKGARLPDGWFPSGADWSWALDQLGEPRAKYELEKFRDYWRARAGAQGVKLDWDATWRNWVRRVLETPAPRAPPPNGRPQTTRERKQDEWDAAYAKLSEAADRHQGGDGGGPPALGLFPPISSGRS